MDLQETIVALATPPGGGARGIVRLSGPGCWNVVRPFFDAPLPEPAAGFGPRAISGSLALPPLTTPIPATLYLSLAPRSFTGQDQVEVHTLGSAPILELAVSSFLARGARAALPGEFTMRAFLGGKLDLTAAEATLGLIDAATPRQAAVALAQLAGGIARPVQLLRDRFLDLLADLEAGLDFVEEDVDFIDRSELIASLSGASEELGRLSAQMDARSVSRERARVAITGPPNAGKSSLFNALLARDAALVSRHAGTTRDYLVGELRLGHLDVDLFDTAGIEHAPGGSVEQKAQAAREELSATADLLLWCVPPGAPNSSPDLHPGTVRDGQDVMTVETKRDQREDEDGDPGSAGRVWRTSSVTGRGIPELREAIAEWAGAGRGEECGVVGGTAARCREAVRGAAAAVDRGLSATRSRASDELVALELRLALDELAIIVGAVYTDDILDRIFSRFCIGK